jgi:hypothetical protein
MQINTTKSIKLPTMSTHKLIEYYNLYKSVNHQKPAMRKYKFWEISWIKAKLPAEISTSALPHSLNNSQPSPSKMVLLEADLLELAGEDAL